MRPRYDELSAEEFRKQLTKVLSKYSCVVTIEEPPPHMSWVLFKVWHGLGRWYQMPVERHNLRMAIIPHFAKRILAELRVCTFGIEASTS